MGRLAKEFMTAPAVTIGPDAPVSDAAHLLREKGLKHLPVVDAGGRIMGMISRVDLLAAFLRGDDAIADDVSADVSRRVPDPEQVRVDVREGVVRLEGILDLRTEAQHLIERLRSLDGVVAVDAERLDWEVDDTVEPVSTVPWVGF
jgi:CBS domain-containing protein